MSEQIYPKGIVTFAKNPKQPDFVLGSAIITIDDFIEWTKQNPNLLTEYNGKKQLRLQCLTKKAGGISFTVDTYKSEPKPEQFGLPKKETPFTDQVNNDSENDLPF